MDPNVLCPKKADKFNHSLTPILFLGFLHIVGATFHFAVVRLLGFHWPQHFNLPWVKMGIQEDIILRCIAAPDAVINAIKTTNPS